MTCRRPPLGAQTSTPSHHKSGLLHNLEMEQTSFMEPKGKLQALIEGIYEILDSSGISGLTDTELSRLKKLVFGAEIPEEEWRPFTVFRHDGYSRNLVDQGNGNFDLLLVAWNPDQSRYLKLHVIYIIFLAVFMIMQDHTA